MRNVLAAADSATLDHDGRRYEVLEVEVVPIDASEIADGNVTARVFGLREALRLRTGEGAPSADLLG
ncbi:hypothetical protein GCM10009819_30080 [Agromyces tropicus]|uniref:Uncharacterized protein n=1 Tax=Agromyces tropicus TaxID=555371 RepID=A0ABP5GBD2_9MICO